MKYIAYISLIIIAVLLTACPGPLVDEENEFKDVDKNTLFSYLTENKERYSSFISIAEAAGLKHTLSAYNPFGVGYTLFLPDNEAIAKHIEESSRFSSLSDIVNDHEYAKAFCDYHVVTRTVNSNSFPFGAFQDTTLSGDKLTVSFIIGKDSTYYMINNSAIVYQPNIEVSNGIIHHIYKVLEPVTYTTYGWLTQQPDYTIFKQAVDLTGFQSLIDINLKTSASTVPRTLLVEPDSIYHKSGIYTIEDLIQYISPGSNDYTNVLNPLYNFVGYHVLSGNIFIDEFVNKSEVYESFSEVPVNINGLGLDIVINKGKQVFDTIIFQSDTTYVDFITFKYDASNILTQTGVIHIIDRVMSPKSPDRSTSTFQFYNEPVLDKLRQNIGSYVIAENSLNRIEWSGADLLLVRRPEGSGAFNNFYMEIIGDFSITYKLPKIVQGRYELRIRAERFSSDNAMIEVYLDNKKVGSAIDLTVGGNANNPFQYFTVATIDFNRFVEHTVEVRPLIPGRFRWDTLQFRPI